MTKFKTNNINETEMVYSLLREKYPDNQIEIEYNDNTKEYTLILTDFPFKEDPEVPLDIKIKVIYGDSCTPDTPILLRDPSNDLVHIETIQSIFDHSKKVEYPGFKMFDTTIRLEKEYSTTEYQVWTDVGWQNIKKVIRHKCDKKIYKILTHTGLVKVTEDHSLLTENKKILKPTECKIGTSLLTSYYNEFTSNIKSISKDRAFIYGFFYGDGSAGRYECKSGLKYSFALNNADMEVLVNLKKLMKKEYPDNEPIIYDTLSSSGVYKLSVNNPKSFVEEYRPLFYDSDKYKKVPTEILNSDNEVIQSFFDGYFQADGCRRDKEKIGCTRFDNKGQIGSAGLYYLMKKLGYKVSLNIRDDKEKMLRLSVTKKKQRKITNKIKKIEIQDYTNDFVYDLETACGRYQAGVGDIILKNTDSVFLSLKYNREDFEKNRRDTFNLSTICGNNITKMFNRNPIDLEFEKVFQPFILLTKKRYIGKKYENVKDPFKLKEITKSGIAITRRDYCKMVKNCYTEVIDCIVNDEGGGIEESIEIYKSYIDRIDNYQIDVDDLVVSAMLAKSYKTRPVHVQLADKLKERSEEVQVGDRLSYIYIENTSGEPKQKSELGEDPVYAKNNGLKYNRGCYLSQLAKPLLGFFKCILEEHQNELEDIIDYTNNKLEEYDGKSARLKLSDYKIKDD
jgi:DNA polymerase family B